MRAYWLLFQTAALTVTMTVLAQTSSTIGQTQPPPKPDGKKTPPPRLDPLDEEILRRAKLSTDAPALLDFFRKRILPEKDRPAVQRLVQRLGSPSYHIREKAMLALIERGIASVEILRTVLPEATDAESIRRIETSLARIQENDVSVEVPAAAVRVLAQHKPAGMNETLLAYLPFADHEGVLDELRRALTANALVDGKVDPILVSALKDRAGIRRTLAAEAIGRTAIQEHRGTLRKLLIDPDPLVRFRVARTLAFAREREVIPVLIDTLPELPLNSAWQAEDFLIQLAGAATPPSAPLGADKESRVKCKDAWHAWWKNHEGKIDLARLEETPKMLGRTLIVLLDQGRILELGPDNMPRFELKNIVFPLDAQMIDDDRVIVAEYHANRVTERNTKGDVLWKRDIVTPLVAQRLPNGSTFIATPHGLHEYDKDNQEVLNVQLSDGNQYIMKAMKLANGEIVCMVADARIVRYSAQGKELHSFPIPLGLRLFGGRVHMMPSGRVLVPHHAEGKVVEYDSKGKVVWEVPFESPIAATRLPNGNTLITSMNPQIGAVEVDRAGTQVWTYQHSSNTRVTRALRR